MATVKGETADVMLVTNHTVSLPVSINRYNSDSDSDAEEAREYLKKVLREEEAKTEKRAKRVRVLCRDKDGSKSGGKRQRTGCDNSFDGSLSTVVMRPLEPSAAAASENGSEVGERALGRVTGGGRQFWKAGDYEYASGGDWLSTSGIYDFDF